MIQEVQEPIILLKENLYASGSDSEKDSVGVVSFNFLKGH